MTRSNPRFLPEWRRYLRPGRSTRSAPRFEVEPMEPRLLLDVNLYDPTDSAGPNQVQNRIVAKLNELFSQLGELGNDLDADDALADQLREVVAPLLGQSLDDLQEVEIGDFFAFARDAAIDNYLNTPAVVDPDEVDPSTGPTSSGLLAEIETAINSIDGLTATVQDDSSGTDLNLSIDITTSGTDQEQIKLGDAGQEFNLNLDEDALIDLERRERFSFRIQADLSDTSASGLGDDDFKIVLEEADVLAAEVLHTSTTNPVDGWGIQVGVLGAGEDGTTSGAYVSATDLRMNLTGQLDLSPMAGGDGELSLSELLAQGGDFSSSFIFSLPTTASTPTVIGQNTADFQMSVDVYNDAASDEHIASLDGVTGILGFQDDNLFDDRAPLVSADDTMTAFSRITASDMLEMVNNTVSFIEALGVSGDLKDFLPMLDLTTGDAYAFGEAFRNVFLGQVQREEMVLTALNAPSTRRDNGGTLESDPLDFTGAAGFNIMLGTGGFTAVSLSADPARATLEDLRDDLNIALDSALPTGHGVVARLTTGESPRLELWADSDTPFLLAGFAGDVDGRLDLGFNAFSEVVLSGDGPLGQPPGTTENQERFQLPELAMTSTGTVDMADFEQVREFDVEVNGGSAVTITLAARTYSDIHSLTTTIRNQMIAAGVYNDIEDAGLNVRVIGESGSESIQFFALPDVHTFSLSGSALSELGLSADTQTSPFMDFDINGGSETYRVFFPGNLTNGIVDVVPNFTVSDLVRDLRVGLTTTSYKVLAGGALSLSPLLDESAGTGIDVRGTTDASGDLDGGLQFFARNPGTATGEIQDFEISDQSADLAHFNFDAGFRASTPFVTSDIQTEAQFASVQEFAALIADAPVTPLKGITTPSPNFNTADLNFTFPIEFSYTPADLTDVDLRLDTDYDKVSNLETDSTVTVGRTTTSSFEFEVGLKPDTTVAEPLSVELPVTLADWDGIISADAVLQFVFDDGVVNELRISADDTLGNVETQDFADQLTAAIAADAALAGKLIVSVKVDPVNEVESIVFTTVPATVSTRMVQLLIPEEIASATVSANAAIDILEFTGGTTSFTSVADTFTATAAPTSLTTTNLALMSFQLPDGSMDTIVVSPEETADNTLLDYPGGDGGLDPIATFPEALVRDINFAIEQSLELTTLYEAKVQAYVDSSGFLAFRLNQDLFPDDGSLASEDWSVTVQADYTQPQFNGLFLDFNARERTLASATTDVRLTAVSGPVTGTNPYKLDHGASFDISVNGSDYIRLSIPSNTGTPSQADLIAAFNTELAATAVTLGMASFTLGDFLKAATYGDGSRISLISLDNSSSATLPEVRSFRILPADVANNEAVSVLGFSEDEQLTGARGGVGALDVLQLTGTATVDGVTDTLTATGGFGFAEWEAASGSLDLVARARTQVAQGLNTRFTLTELLETVSEGAIDDITVTNVDPSTYATLVLEDLTFTADSQGVFMTGLEFGAAPTITISHSLTGASLNSSIDDFAAPPAPDVAYADTNGMENLFKLGFEDVLEGLQRTADFVSDQMRIDPDGAGPSKNAFSTKLLFVREGMQEIFDLGFALDETISELTDARPRTLQEVRRSIADLLQLNFAEVVVELDTSFIGGVLDEASVVIQFPFMQALSVSLPLFIDLVQLRDRSSDPAIVDQDLAGLSALASSRTNPLDVSVNLLAELNLDIAVVAVEDGEAIQPKTILRDTTEILTHFNLAGEGLTGDLPVGNARFRLTNGQVAVNAHGEVANDDEFGTPGVYNNDALEEGYVAPVPVSVRVASTEELSGAFSSGTITASANEALDVDGVSAFAVGDRILVNHQSDLAQNGIYRVVRAGSATDTWQLARDAVGDSAAELNSTIFEASEGTAYANRMFEVTQPVGTLNTDPVRFARRIDPAVFEISLNGDQILAYTVIAATTSQLDADYVETGDPTKPKAYRAELVGRGNGSINQMSTILESGRQVLGIDGQANLSVNDFVLIKDQANDAVTSGDIRYQNGIYRVADLGSSTSSWRLVRVDWVDEIQEFDELRVKVTSGRDNIGETFVQQTTTLGVEVSAGENFDFSSALERVYSNYNATTTGFDLWADINPNGQAQALLPMVIVVTDENGNEVIITKDTSELTEAQKEDSAIVAALPDFVPVNIRVLDEPISGRTGLDRLFDVTVGANTPGVAAPVVFFTNPDVSARKLEFPALGPNIPPVDVLNILRDPFLMGEALDLTLFNLQFAIDQVLGNTIALLGTSLPDYTPFIEEFRSTLTGRVRDELRNNKLKPINALLDSLFSILGPNGANYLIDENGDTFITREDIQVVTLDAAETATVWDPLDADNYDRNGANEEFEVTPGSAVSLEFVFDLVKPLDDNSSEVTVDQINLGVPELGISFSNETATVDANGNPVNLTGGVNLRRSFHLNMGFGVDLSDGFYFFNPENNAPADRNPLMTVDVEAVLDGDLDTPGVQVFEQANRSSSWNELNVQMADAMDIPGATDLASGFYGTFDFFLNSGSGGANAQRMTLEDMQALSTLGVDQATSTATVSSLVPRGIFDFELNGDTDIHLLVEGGKSGSSFGNSGIPDIQFEFYYQERFGSGYDGLNYGPMAAAQAGPNADPDMPSFRYNRSEIDIVDMAYTGLTIDVQGFLEGTIFEALMRFEEGYSNIRPIVDFLLTPVPGTEWMNEPFVLGDLFGAGFISFASTVNRLSDMVQSISEQAQGSERQPNWAKPRVAMTASGNLANKTSPIKALKRALGTDEAREKFLNDNQRARDLRAAERSLRDDPIKWTNNPLYSGPPVSERETKKSLKDSFKQKVLTPNKYADRFEKFRDRGFAVNQRDGRLKSFVKKQANQALAGTDDRKGATSPIVGLTGGGFRLDYVQPENIFKILNGETANLTFLELPRLELGVAYTKSFPLPAFPPLIATVGGSFSINVHLKFGWDTQGFYWSTLDTAGQPSSAFGLQGRFTVGVALSAGFIEAGIEAFFEIDVDFNWNDVTANRSGSVTNWGGSVDADAFPRPPNFGDVTSIDYGKLRQSQMDYLATLPGDMDNLFDVTITGRVGVTFYVDLTIPIPFVGPITKRILAKTFSMEIFQTTVFAAKPTIQLGSVSGGTLQLHIGTHANLRLFGDTRDRNEVFTITSRGAGSGNSENVTVTAVLNNVTFNQNFDNVTRIVGTAGGGQSVIDARALTRATVFFTGGDGNTILYSGNGNATSAKNELRGGSGTATLVGATTRGSILRGGASNTVIIGGSGADQIYSGARSDRLVGGGGGDTYFFGDNFGRDRIEVTGTGNTVDFSSAVDDVTFDLGRLVQSAKSGLNTVFFAPDESGVNTIDTWIGGQGDDRFNTFFFAPDRTLNINGGQGNNFYAVTLGNPSTRYFADTNPSALLLADKMNPRNIGTIDITDPTGQGHMLIKQTSPERINFDRTYVDNGREQATMTGMGRVDLDAGNTTLVWGQEGVEWIDLGAGAEITAGTIEMISSVEAEGLTLNLKRAFSITQRINLRNNSDLVINLQNPDPLADSSLFMGPAPGHTAAWTPGIYSSSGSVFASQPAANIGDGEGRITINTPTGSVFNLSPTRTGVIQALNGEVVLEVRDTIGLNGDPIKVNTKYLAGKTTTTAATLAQGIHLISDTDLHIVRLGNVDGLSTVSGRIDVEVGPGALLQYANISAGDERDVVLTADRIETSPGKQEVIQVSEAFQNTRQETVRYSVPILVTETIPVWWLFGTRSVTYSYWTTIDVTLTRTVEFTDYRLVDQTILVNPGGSIATEGNVRIRNATDLMDIEIGKASVSPGVLSVSEGLLDTIAATAAAIVVGRSSEESTKSGTATVYNYGFDQGLIVHASEVDIPGTGTAANLSSDAKLEFHTYDVAGGGDGSIEIDAGADLQSLTISGRAFGDITVDGSLELDTASGLLDLAAGVGPSTTGGASNTGNLTVSSTGSLLANVTNATINLASGILGGDLNISGSIESLASLSLEALGGGVTVDNSVRVAADRLASTSRTASTLYTDVRQIDSATVLGAASGGTLFLDELDAVDIRFMQTDTGTITLNVGGNLTVGRIDATGVYDVVMDIEGSVLGDDPAPTPPVLPDSVFNVRASDLQVDAAGGIQLITDISVLDAQTEAAGAILITNDGGQTSPLRVDEAITADGRVEIDTEGDIDVRNIVSQTSSAANLISVTTRPLFGGEILVDVIDAGALGNVSLDAGDFTLGGPITFGGTIKSDSSTTGRITANQLTALARGYAEDPDNLTIDLRTSVAELIARTFTGGDPAGGADSRADIQINEQDTIRLVDVQTADGDFTIVAGQTITHDDVQTPGRDQFFTATTGDILHGNGKLFGRDLVATAPGELNLNTTMDTVDLQSTLSGAITLTESDSVLLKQVTTEDGAIDITAGEFDGVTGLVTKGGNVEVGVVRAGTAGDQNVSITAAGRLEMADTVLYPLAKIRAALFNAVSYGRMNLITAMDTFTGTANTLGNLSILEDDQVVLQSVQAENGSIDIVSGGTMTAELVEVLTDIAQASTFDISLRTTAGDILIDLVNAGLLHNDLSITAEAGSIEEVNPEDPGADLIADVATLNATGGIGSLRALETSFNTLTANSTVAGALDLNETDGIFLERLTTADGDITVDSAAGDVTVDLIRAGATRGSDLFLNAFGGSILEAGADADADLQARTVILNAAGSIQAQGGGYLETWIEDLIAHATAAGSIELDEVDALVLQDVDTLNGLIDIETGGQLTATDVASLTDADANDIELHVLSGDLLVDLISAGPLAGDLTIFVDNGGIQEVNPEDTGEDLIADVATINASGGIGSVRALETRFNELVMNSTVAGNIDLNETDSIFLNTVTTEDGTITIDTATGDATVDLIRAGATRGSDLFLNVFGGSLLEAGADADADLQARNVTLNVDGSIQAQGGGYLETWIENVIAHATAAGSIELDEVDALVLQDVDTLNGFIDIETGGQLTATDVASLTDADANDIDLHVLSGDLLVDRISAGPLAGDLTVMVDNGGIQEVSPEDAGNDLIADVATINASGGIGSVRALETRFNELVMNSTVAGNIDLNETDTIFLNTVTTEDGTITIDSATGDVTLDLIRAGASRGSDLFLNVFGGSLFETGADADADLQARNVTLNVDGNIQAQGGGYLETWIEDLIAHATAAGSIELDEVDALVLQDVDTLNGFIDIETGGQLTATDVASLTDADANDIDLHVLSGDLLVNLISAGSLAGDLTISVDNGGIQEVSPEDAGNDLIADVATINASGGIGSVRALETRFNELVMNSTLAGNIDFNEADDIFLNTVTTQDGNITIDTTTGTVSIDLVRAGATRSGDLWLNALGGGIQEAGAGDAAEDILANEVFITATAGIGDLKPLELRVDELTGSSSVAGGIDLNETDDLKIHDLTTQLGDIVLDLASGDLALDLIRAGALRQSDLTITTLGGSLLETDVDADADLQARNVTLNVSGSIAQQGGGYLETWIEELIAQTTAPGSIELDEVDALILQDVDTLNGFIDIESGAQLTAIDLASLTDNDANDITLTVLSGDLLVDRISAGVLNGDLTVDVQAGGIQEITPEDMDEDLLADVANIMATGGIGSMNSLETSFNQLVMQSTVAGDIDLNETDGIFINNLTTQDGNITFDSAAGDVVVNLIQAGASRGNDLELNAFGGALFESGSDVEEDILARNVTLNVAGAIGEVGGGYLETFIDELIAITTAAGDIELEETDDVILREVKSFNGFIDILTGGEVTAVDVQSLTDSDANDITLMATTGDILVDRVDTGGSSGDLYLTALTGGLEERVPVDGGVDLRADRAEIDVNLGIGSRDPIETRFNSLSMLANGDIRFDEISSIRMDSVVSRSGAIIINVGENLTAIDIRTLADGPANSITLNVQGRLEVDAVIAGADTFGGGNPAAGAPVFITAGNVQEFGSDAEVDIRGSFFSLTAGSFGGGDPIETSARELLSLVGGTNQIRNFSGTAVQVQQLTGAGRILFEQNGGADPFFDLIRAGGGLLEIVVQDSGKLFVNQLQSGGDVLLLADDMDFVGGPGSIRGTGSISLGAIRGNVVLVINAFDDLRDQPGLLTLDRTDLFALDFPREIFLGDVEFVLPAGTLGDTGLLFTSTSDPDLEGVETGGNVLLPGPGFAGSFLSQQAVEDFFASFEREMPASFFTTFLSEIGFSFTALTEPGSDLEKLLLDAGIPMEDWVEWFSRQTGYSPSSLSGMNKSFFSQLRIRLADSTVFTTSDRSTVAVRQQSQELLSPVWTTTRSGMGSEPLDAVPDRGWQDVWAEVCYAAEAIPTRLLSLFRS